MYTLAQQMKDGFREEFIETLGPQFREEGREVGREEGKKETAIELLKRGIDMDIIAAATGLSREELEEMASQIQ